MSAEKSDLIHNQSNLLEVNALGSEDDDNINISSEIFSSSYTNEEFYSPKSRQYVPKNDFSRYGNAIKHLIPFRKKSNKKFLKIDEVGLFSLMCFSWVTKYIVKAYKKGLTLDDIPLCSPFDSCDLNSQRLEFLWQEELAARGPVKASFGRAAWRFVRTRVLIGTLIFATSCVMGFLSPTVFLRKLLEYLDEPNESKINGIIWALALTGSEFLRIMFLALYYSLSYRTGLRLRSACLALIYKKILRLNSTGNTSTGSIINLFGVDGPQLYYVVVIGPMAIGGPVISLCVFLYIYYILGSWALLGMIIFVLYYPLQYLLSKLTGYYREKAVKFTDRRIKQITEVLTTIKVIKMYAWEKWFSCKIKDVRNKELKEIEKISYCQSVGISLAPTIPVISGIVTFLIHVVAGGNLTAAQAFSVLVCLTKQMKTSIQMIRDGTLTFYEGLVSVQRFKVYTILVILHTQLRTALNNIKFGSDNIVHGRIIFNRFQNVLTLQENLCMFSREVDESLALSIKDGFFSRNTAAIELEASPKKAEQMNEGKLLEKSQMSMEGALIGICGPVGAGKTSLLLACLGQLELTKGRISRTGTCAYVSQQLWIENANVRDNILFGEKYDREKYANVLRACALKEDLDFLPGGDDTEIGERGVNLSGGQKQRISLARALYSNRDLYFLDDPLSAVDPPVAAEIFDKYIVKALGQKTVLLVTNQMQFLSNCDEILVLRKGRIIARGVYDELIKENAEFGSIIQHNSSTSERFRKQEEDINGLNNEHREPPERNQKVENSKSFNKKLTVAEEQIRGSIKAGAFRAYVSAAGGHFACFFVILIILSNVGSNVFSSWWLAMWIKAGSGNTTVNDPVTNETTISRDINDNPDLLFYMKIYASIIGLIIATCVIRGFLYTKVTIRASKVLHQKLYANILRSSMRYFERTPIGQIQNLFSRDFDEIDSRLPEGLETMLQNVWTVIFSFLSIILVFNWFILPFVFIATFYYFTTKIFRVAVRDLKRLENISRAPVFSWVSATMQGLPVILGFNRENSHVIRFCRLFDENSNVFYLSNNAMRWMAVRLDFISVMVSLIISFLVVFLKGQIVPAFAGLALTYAAQICGVFQYTIRLLTENEARFVSVERIQNVIEKLTKEGSCSGEKMKVGRDWPSSGEIKFENVRLSYGENLPLVLNDLSFSISGGEKIGVVGRTGAGKSSLATALFRLAELSSGVIYIDGVNVAKLPLPVLRSHLSVIPQDPTVFNETIRANLDPFHQYDDWILWEVLNKTQLSAKIKSLPEQLSTYIGETDNLSFGEKQLICLSRTLLRGSKVLILDEATASIDPETEVAIQMTIRNEFKDCTVITIAHRLSTVMSCDRILVMDQGMVLEYDSPEVLAENPDSLFAKMLESSQILKKS